MIFAIWLAYAWAEDLLLLKTPHGLVSISHWEAQAGLTIAQVQQHPELLRGLLHHHHGHPTAYDQLRVAGASWEEIGWGAGMLQPYCRMEGEASVFPRGMLYGRKEGKGMKEAIGGKLKLDFSQDEQFRRLVRQYGFLSVYRQLTDPKSQPAVTNTPRKAAEPPATATELAACLPVEGDTQVNPLFEWTLEWFGKVPAPTLLEHWHRLYRQNVPAKTVFAIIIPLLQQQPAFDQLPDGLWSMVLDGWREIKPGDADAEACSVACLHLLLNQGGIQRLASLIVPSKRVSFAGEDRPQVSKEDEAITQLSSHLLWLTGAQAQGYLQQVIEELVRGSGVDRLEMLKLVEGAQALVQGADDHQDLVALDWTLQAVNHWSQGCVERWLGEAKNPIDMAAIIAQLEAYERLGSLGGVFRIAKMQLEAIVEVRLGNGERLLPAFPKRDDDDEEDDEAQFRLVGWWRSPSLEFYALQTVKHLLEVGLETEHQDWLAELMISETIASKENDEYARRRRGNLRLMSFLAHCLTQTPTGNNLEGLEGAAEEELTLGHRQALRDRHADWIMTQPAMAWAYLLQIDAQYLVEALPTNPTLIAHLQTNHLLGLINPQRGYFERACLRWLLVASVKQLNELEAKLNQAGDWQDLTRLLRLRATLLQPNSANSLTVNPPQATPRRGLLKATSKKTSEFATLLIEALSSNQLYCPLSLLSKLPELKYPSSICHATEALSMEAIPTLWSIRPVFLTRLHALLKAGC